MRRNNARKARCPMKRIYWRDWWYSSVEEISDPGKALAMWARRSET